jgi:hypothetical protein
LTSERAFLPGCKHRAYSERKSLSILLSSIDREGTTGRAAIGLTAAARPAV